MEHVNFSLFLLFIPSVCCALSIFMVILTKKENKLLSRQLTEITVSLELTRNQMAEFQEKSAKTNEFQNSLQVAELTTKLQKPRLNAQKIDATQSTSGKYGNLRSLAQKGMSTVEIASVMAISTHEAHQLVNLSKLAHGNFADNVTG